MRKLTLRSGWLAIIFGLGLAMPQSASTQSWSDLGAERIVTNPDWALRPSGEDIAKHYPEAARQAGIEGRALIRCLITEKGRLDYCKVVSEDPLGAGFGGAALAMTTLFWARPMNRDGKPVAGGTIRIPISFRLPKG